MAKRERWTEADVDALANEEPDSFDRKSGQLLANQDSFSDAVAKALSAFANSGGGSLLLGVRDDGTFDGVPRFVGNASTRDWIEQKIPHLLDYALSDFRVHTALRSDPSRIPDGREVIAIDVGDSALAPHQSKRDRKYYHRQGGRSEPAPHFYLELLRQRLTSPILTFSLAGVDWPDVYEHDGGIFADAKLQFRIQNEGRIAAYKWGLNIRQLACDESDFLERRRGE